MPDNNGTSTMFTCWALIESRPLTPVEVVDLTRRKETGEHIQLPVAVNPDGSLRACLLWRPSLKASFTNDELFAAKVGEKYAFPLRLSEIERWGIRNGDKLVVDKATYTVLAVNGCADVAVIKARPLTHTPYLDLNTTPGAADDVFAACKNSREDSMKSPLVADGTFKAIPADDVNKLMWWLPLLRGNAIAICAESKLGKTTLISAIVHEGIMHTCHDDHAHYVVLGAGERAAEIKATWENLKKVPHKEGLYEVFVAPAGTTPNGVVWFVEFVMDYMRRLAEMPHKHVYGVIDSVPGALQMHGFGSTASVNKASLQKGVPSGSVFWLLNTITSDIGTFEGGGSLTLLMSYFREGAFNTGTQQVVAYAETAQYLNDTIFLTPRAQGYPAVDCALLTPPRNWGRVFARYSHMAARWHEGLNFVLGGGLTSPRPTLSPEAVYVRNNFLAMNNRFFSEEPLDMKNADILYALGENPGGEPEEPYDERPRGGRGRGERGSRTR